MAGSGNDEDLRRRMEEIERRVDILEEREREDKVEIDRLREAIEELRARRNERRQRKS
jgi:chaperonin cofactor prefoldin